MSNSLYGELEKLIKEYEEEGVLDIDKLLEDERTDDHYDYNNPCKKC